MPINECDKCGAPYAGMDTSCNCYWAKTIATQPQSIDETLKQRGSRYGKFTDHASYTQRLKAVAQGSPNWSKMEYDLREGLEMILHKIGRILSGDPNYADNWHDIVGYAKLVDDRLQSGAEQ